MRTFICILLLSFFQINIYSQEKRVHPIRILVITGGHEYNKETFDDMLKSLGEDFTFTTVEFPAAFEMFQPSKRNCYDVIIFYHMWQSATKEQEKTISDCISAGKPLIVLHHSICAFDDWPEYCNITGGKYFHKKTIVGGKEYPVSSYIHDLHFIAHIEDREYPVTKGINDFELFDETYKGCYVEPGVKILITTTDSTSTPVIGWTKMYGKARVVTLQSGHDTPTFQNPDFRKLLRQAIRYVSE